MLASYWSMPEAYVLTKEAVVEQHGKYLTLRIPYACQHHPSMPTPVEGDSVTDACKLESTKTKSPHLGHPLMDKSKAASQAKMFWPASSCALIRPEKFARSYANMTRYASASRADRQVRVRRIGPAVAAIRDGWFRAFLAGGRTSRTLESRRLNGSPLMHV
ncbi:hypothetical protein CSAL01_09581 [Colletotrichum salicis]|uniref:Uncharacterized protein n=1 Tax=Colletotrichum salicis TaxID=1209931 RepID=A0A135UGH5_9PEZI|nr:hypothetical protein CSAL01_09581 [Colletotrichum salicis]